MFSEEYADAPYLGIMFLGAFIGSIVAAIGIHWHEPLWGWGLGVLIGLGSIVGYILSRTVGLPISGIEPWGPAIGYVSLALEIVFVVLSATVLDDKNASSSLLQRRRATSSR